MEPKPRAVEWSIGIPLLVAIATGVCALAGTIWTGLANTKLERNKFEYGLIQAALSAPTQSDKAQQLRFLLDVGLLSGLNEDNIRRLSADGGTHLPSGVSISMNLMPLEKLKTLLSMLRDENNIPYYQGKIDGINDAGVYLALSKFQRSHGLAIDGSVGARTLLALQDACSGLPCAKLLSPDPPAGGAAP